MKLPNSIATPTAIPALFVWIMLASVVLNLFLVGVVASGLPSAKHKSFTPAALAAPHSEYMVDWMVRYLDPRDAGLFRDVFQAHVAELKAAHEHVKEATKAEARAFEQDPLDPAALEQAVAEVKQAKTEANKAADKIVLESAAKLSADGRHRLAELTR